MLRMSVSGAIILAAISGTGNREYSKRRPGVLKLDRKLSLSVSLFSARPVRFKFFWLGETRQKDCAFCLAFQHLLCATIGNLSVAYGLGNPRSLTDCLRHPPVPCSCLCYASLS